LMAKIIAIALLVGAVLYVVFNDFTTWMNGGSSVFGALLGKFSDFKNMAVRIFGVLKDIFKSFWEALNTNSAESWGKFLKAIWRAFSGVGEVLEFIITKVVNYLTTFIGNAVLMIITSVGNLIKFIVSRVAGLGQAIFEGLAKTKLGKIIGGFVENLPTQQGGLPPSMGGLGGGYIVPPARTLSSLNSTSNSQNVNVKNTIAVTVPPGTSEQQQAFLHEAAMKSFEASFSKKINESLYAVPRGEQ